MVVAASFPLMRALNVFPLPGLRVMPALLMKSEVLLEPLYGDRSLRQQLLKFLKRLDEDPAAMQEFEDWTMSPYTPHLQHFTTPANPKEHSSLQSYFNAPACLFSRLDADSQLKARPRPDNSSLTRKMTPRVLESEHSVSCAIKHRIPSSRTQ